MLQKNTLKTLLKDSPVFTTGRVKDTYLGIHLGTSLYRVVLSANARSEVIPGAGPQASTALVLAVAGRS